MNIHELSAEIAKYNGIITMDNRRSGGYVYVKLKTKTWTKMINGEKVEQTFRIAAWGKTRAADQDFAFVSEDGRLKLWNRFSDKSVEAKLAKLLNQPHAATHAGVRFGFEKTCRECGRKLTTPDSIRLGVGPVCMAQWKSQWVRLKALSDDALVGELRAATQGPRAKWNWTTVWFIHAAFRSVELREAAFWGVDSSLESDVI